MSMVNEKIFVRSGILMTDIDLFLQGSPPEDIEFEFFGPEHSLAHLMHRAGLFPSISLARKSGWNRPVPPGYSEYIVGKRKFKVTVLNHF